MLKRDTIQSISLVLVVAVTLWGTGITRAAMDAAYGSPEQPAPVRSAPVESTGWTPLTDAEMDQIEGGIAVIAWFAIGIVIGVIVCVVYEGLKSVYEPDDDPNTEIIIEGPDAETHEWDEIIIEHDSSREDCHTHLDSPIGEEDQDTNLFVCQPATTNFEVDEATEVNCSECS